MNGTQAKLVIGALRAIAYGLLAWTLTSVSQVQQDIAGIQVSLTRMERDASEFLTKREFEFRRSDLIRRLEALEKRP